MIRYLCGMALAWRAVIVLTVLLCKGMIGPYPAAIFL